MIKTSSDGKAFDPNFIYTENQVREMWKRSYSEQIGIAQAKCIEAITRTEGKIAVSFSGGKDSAVVLYLMAEMWSISKHKKEPLKVFFADTSNEFTCVRNYISFYLDYIEKKFDITTDFVSVRGEKSYIQTTDEIGFPFISKKVARMVHDCRRDMEKLHTSYKDIKKYLPSHYTGKYYDEMVGSADVLRRMGFSDGAILYLTKIRSDNNIGKRFLPIKYRPMIDFEERFSDKCCERLKKEPIKMAQKSMGDLLPVTGEMACDSADRLESYRKTGCNYFEGKQRKSKPIGPVTEQTILKFIYDEKIPVLPVYGEISYNPETNTYSFSGEQRTGCKLCGFGIAFDPDRYERLYKIEPKIVQFAFTSRENGGMGYRQICEKLNSECGMKIQIPDCEEGFYKKRALAHKERK